MKVILRVYFSSYHHWAASHFSELAQQIEGAHSGEPSFDIRHRAYVTNAVLSSVAFMEAAINELFQDVVDSHESYVSPLSKNTRALMASHWSMTEGHARSALPVVDRYQLVLNFAGLEMFSEGKQPYQDAQLLVRLRNYLIHYKPEDVSRGDEHKLEKQLRGKFPENQMMPGNPFIPDRCLGAGCAHWSVRASRAYLDEFHETIQVVPNYQRVSFGQP